MSEDKEQKHPESEETPPATAPAEDGAGEPLEEALKDPGMETLKRYAPMIGALIVSVFAVFAFSQWRTFSKRESKEVLNQSYLEALDSGEPAKLIAFAKDNQDEPLAGLALYQVASIQYGDADFSAAAETFGRAASLLQPNDEPLPLAARSILGQGISLIKADQAAAGKEKLLQVAQGKFFAASARGEAWHHLGIHALSEGDDAAYATAEKALDSDKAFDSWSVALRGRKSSQGFIAKARQRRKVPLSETNLQAGQRFLDENKKRKGVVTLESGLQYEILIEGNGTSPKAVDEVEVHYHGTLLDGEVFDSSVDREEPSRFGLGAVIAGWTEGLQLMKTGGTWKFFISPALAYGESGSRDIGPNETLTFEVELREVFPAPPPPQPQSESNATVVPPSVFRPEGNASIVVPTVPDGNGSK